MKAVKAKQLRKDARKATIGQPKKATRKKYLQLKKEAKTKTPQKVKPRISKRQLRKLEAGQI